MGEIQNMPHVYRPLEYQQIKKYVYIIYLRICVQLRKRSRGSRVPVLRCTDLLDLLPRHAATSVTGRKMTWMTSWRCWRWPRWPLITFGAFCGFCAFVLGLVPGNCAKRGQARGLPSLFKRVACSTGILKEEAAENLYSLISSKRLDRLMRTSLTNQMFRFWILLPSPAFLSCALVGATSSTVVLRRNYQIKNA